MEFSIVLMFVGGLIFGWRANKHLKDCIHLSNEDHYERINPRMVRSKYTGAYITYRGLEGLLYALISGILLVSVIFVCFQ